MSKTQYWFPSSYVEECDFDESFSNDKSGSVLGSEQKGAIYLSGCTVYELVEGSNNRPFVFRVNPITGEFLDIACDTAEERRSWIEAIRECNRNHNELV